MLLECVLFAFRGSVSMAGAWAPLPGALIVFAGLRMMGYQIAAPETWEQGIAAFLLCAGAAWVIIFISRLMHWPYRQLKIARGQLAKALTRSLNYLNNRDSELGESIREMARQSAWGKCYSAQILVQSGKPAEEENRLRAASSLVSRAIVDGKIEVRGRAPGKIEYESIPRTHWRSTGIIFIKDPITLWRMILIPVNGAEITPDGQVFARDKEAERRNSILSKFDSLIVDAVQFENVCPEKDEQMDKLRRKFLRTARRRHLDKSEIDRLSG